MNRGNKNSGKSHRRKSAKDFIDDMKRLDEDDDGLGGSNRNATEGTVGQEIAMSLNLHIPPNDTDLKQIGTHQFQRQSFMPFHMLL